MKRGWNTLSSPDEQGSEESYRKAQALAAISEPEFLDALVTVKAALNQWGGQYMVAAQRERINVHGQRDPKGQIHVTIGLVHHFKHVPDALKDALREPSPDSLENVEPIEWMDEGQEEITPEQAEALTGMSPEELAALDPDWEEFEPDFEAQAEPPEDPDEADHQAEREADLAAREK